MHVGFGDQYFICVVFDEMIISSRNGGSIVIHFIWVLHHLHSTHGWIVGMKGMMVQLIANVFKFLESYQTNIDLWELHLFVFQSFNIIQPLIMFLIHMLVGSSDQDLFLMLSLLLCLIWYGSGGFISFWKSCII